MGLREPPIPASLPPLPGLRQEFEDGIPKVVISRAQ